ncbi:hypothetical protein TKV_c06980 [Thermoanaerobacter kivui]|uniref:Uncharacterized protein n=1 Tax=Thermoanaerobacter kivui TaxID=2325 RepID=A0A097AQ13_THEKI|nr:hypothetical protein TKV_c06980 [Thermoanaerobacter kivui]
MGKFANTSLYKVLLWTIGIIVTVLNVMLLMSFVG